jgi:hypothetical protein
VKKDAAADDDDDDDDNDDSKLMWIGVSRIVRVGYFKP